MDLKSRTVAKKKSGGRKEAYLTRRVLRRAIAKDSEELVKEALKIRGYVVQVSEGWIVRVERSGKITRLKQLPKRPKTASIKLD
jgi:hypothetical protein